MEKTHLYVASVSICSLKGGHLGALRVKAQDTTFIFQSEWPQICIVASHIYIDIRLAREYEIGIFCIEARETLCVIVCIARSRM